MHGEFECPSCGSPAVEFPNILKSEAPAKCQRCKAVICSLAEFRRQIYWQQSEGRTPDQNYDAVSQERDAIRIGTSRILAGFAVAVALPVGGPDKTLL
jgi:hypothetical protein